MIKSVLPFIYPMLGPVALSSTITISPIATPYPDGFKLKNINSFLACVCLVGRRHTVSHSYHVVMPSVLTWFDGYLWIYFSRNAIKLNRACVIWACILCFTLLFDGLRTELTIMERTSPVFELLIILVPWENPIVILPVPSKSIYLGMWVCCWPSNYRPILLLVWPDIQGIVYFISWPFHRF